MKSNGWRRLGGGFVLANAIALAASGQEVGEDGFLLGSVHEVDKAAYRAYVEELRRQDTDFDESLLELEQYEFLEEKRDVTVTARQLSSNLSYSSGFSNGDGDYMIRETPVGTFDFTLLHEGLEYPVRQRLDLNVELSYVAELCFIVDPEEQIAWMVSDGIRRSPEVPPWVPRRCTSQLSACIALLTGNEGVLSKGLLLLFAAGGATTAAVGIVSTDQTEVSPPVQPRDQPER